MTRITGANLFASFQGTTISGDQTSLEDEDAMGLADASAAADPARTYLNTLTEGTATITAKHQADGTAATYIYNKCAPGASGTLIVGPEGTATGKPKRTVVAVVEKRGRKFPFDDTAEITIDFKYNGSISDATF